METLSSISAPPNNGPRDTDTRGIIREKPMLTNLLAAFWATNNHFFKRCLSHIHLSQLSSLPIAATDRLINPSSPDVQKWRRALVGYSALYKAIPAKCPTPHNKPYI
jgi:hypothetical protein